MLSRSVGRRLWGCVVSRLAWVEYLELLVMSSGAPMCRCGPRTYIAHARSHWVRRFPYLPSMPAFGPLPEPTPEVSACSDRTLCARAAESLNGTSVGLDGSDEARLMTCCGWMSRPKRCSEPILAYCIICYELVKRASRRSGSRRPDLALGVACWRSLGDAPGVLWGWEGASVQEVQHALVEEA